MPTPTPTSAQIETVREIVNISSVAETETRIETISDEAWTATIADITEWNKVKNKFTNLSGGPSGVDIDKSRNRLGLRNRVRVRLGLAEVDSYGSDINCHTGTSFSVNEIVY